MGIGLPGQAAFVWSFTSVWRRMGASVYHKYLVFAGQSHSQIAVRQLSLYSSCTAQRSEDIRGKELQSLSNNEGRHQCTTPHKKTSPSHVCRVQYQHSTMQIYWPNGCVAMAMSITAFIKGGFL